MKLAEALVERADLQKAMKAIKERITLVMRQEVGDTLEEKVDDLVKEFTECNERLSTLVVRINQTNAATVAGSGTITDMIESRDKCVRVRNLYQELSTQKANDDTVHYRGRSKEDVKFELTYSPKKYRGMADAAAKQARELDVKLQSINWTVELL